MSVWCLRFIIDLDLIQVDWVTMNFVPFAEKSVDMVVNLYIVAAKHPVVIQACVLQKIIQVCFTQNIHVYLQKIIQVCIACI